jgi:tRNA-specific 2-thiouridylase
MCNRDIRWGFLQKRTLAIGADYLATGHYARIKNNGKYQLLRAIDQSKDQSYVLHVLNQDHLSRTIFPLGEYTKSEVRDLAKQLNLPVADRKDSQDLCFLGQSDYRSFLLRHAPETNRPGPIHNLKRQAIGEHQGLAFYTIGQRKGLGIHAPQPFYVIEKDQKNNILIVAAKEELGSSELTTGEINWISGSALNGEFRAKVKIRYTAACVWGIVSPISNNRVKIKFEEPLLDITPGQAAVIYDGDICLGGGIIANVTPVIR